jgi:hypothetical protein
MKKRSRIIFFSFIAFLVITENIGNVYSLMGGLEKTAELMGVSVQDERTRILILIFLDAVPAIGALLALWAYKNTARIQTGRIGVALTTNGLLAYGAYQFWAATYQLGFMPTMHKFIGIFYGLLGIAAWYAGNDLRERQS